MPLETRQENQESSTHGGKREGAGRKPMHGAEEVTSKMKRKFTEYTKEEDVKKIVEGSVQKAKDGSENMQKFLIEQWFGKATMKIAGDEDGDALQLIHILKHGSDNKPTS